MGLFSKLINNHQKKSERAYFSYLERNGCPPPIEEIMEEFSRHEMHKDWTLMMYNKGVFSEVEYNEAAKRMAIQLDQFITEYKLTNEEYLAMTNEYTGTY